MAQVVYKKLLGMRAALADLAEVQPQLMKGLQQMLTFEGDVEATFCRYRRLQAFCRRTRLLTGWLCFIPQ